MTQSSDKSDIATAYNGWAEIYDTALNRTRDLAAEVLKHANLDLNRRKVIEVGCGTARNTAWLADRDAEIVALDFSDEMLAKARNRVNDPRVRFVQHDVRTKWPLADSWAEVVIAMLILEHIQNLETFFAEAARVLSNRGELFVCELHPMRQLTGGQAQFSNPTTGERQRVRAFLHDVSQYVNLGLSAGFELEHLGEWRDEAAELNSIPRVLSLLFRLRGE